MKNKFAISENTIVYLIAILTAAMGVINVLSAVTPAPIRSSVASLFAKLKPNEPERSPAPLKSEQAAPASPPQRGYCERCGDECPNARILKRPLRDRRQRPGSDQRHYAQQDKRAFHTYI